ncbi:long-chain fatty acid--CoA ligase [candidate division KSB1 bacterium]|nr:long-chain fatty acid--CoA ligase [candidate division KSB1 bacterium]
MKTTPKVFHNSVQKYGQKTALRQKNFGLWQDISWNEYFQKAKHIGLALTKLGLQKGDRVSLIGDNCPEWVEIDMGIQCVGGVTVGIYTTNAWKQNEYVVSHSESKFYFVENEEQLDKWLHFRDKVPHLKKVIVWDLLGLRDFKDPMVKTLDELINIGKEEDEKNPSLMQELMDAVEPDDLAALIYTSGTTGAPKGAMLTHANVTSLASSIEQANPMYETDEVLSFLPLCHIFERLFSVFVHIGNGYVVNFVENLETVSDNVREVSPTVGYAVPRIWEKYSSFIFIKMSDATWFKKSMFYLAQKISKKYTLAKLKSEPISFFLAFGYRIVYFIVFRKLKERLGFERIRIAYSGAAPISPDVLIFFQSIGMNLVEGYGQTEGTGVTSVSRMGEAKIGTVGKPIPGVEVKIADDGEILVKSPGNFKGYFKDALATKETLKDGWLYSGDVGRLDEEGNLIITDRKKDLIITAGGKNIAPQYIENQLKFSPYINDAVIIGDGRKFITAIVMLDEDNVVKYAQDNKIQFSTYGDLAQNSLIEKLINEEVNKVNNGLSRVEQVKKFTILPKKLYEEDGEVTPTMKVKRKFINENYRDLINDMYRRK